MMQRLFSIFPDSAPGVGLLLLRICGGLSFISYAVGNTWHALAIIAVLAGGSLVLGYATPVVAALQASWEFWRALIYGDLHSSHLVLAVVGLSLVLLGPGAFSLDAKLYGRRRLNFDDFENR